MTEPGLPWPLFRSIARVVDAPFSRLAELLREEVLPLRADIQLTFTDECTWQPQKKAGVYWQMLHALRVWI